MRQIKFNDFQAEGKVHKREFNEAFKRVLTSGWYILGQEVASFEQQFADFLGIKYCVGVGNGLEALQISLMALGIGEGDEVITTPISAVATTLAILAVGAKPVFVDTNDRGLINHDLIEAVLTKKTKAILPVHLYGLPVGLDQIQRICRKYSLFLIEDACQAHGSLYKNKKLGTFGDLGCFSFYPTKNLGALGDGGAVVTNNNKLATTCRQIRDYGQAGKYEHVRVGINSRLDELQAALLKIKLKYLDEDNKKRQEIAKRYIAKLSPLEKVEVIRPDILTDSNFHLFVIKLKQRDKLQEFLKQFNIPTLIHYPVLIPDQPFLKGDYSLSNLRNAQKFVDQILSLPCHPYLTVGQVKFIAQKVTDFFN